jgi:hypothetical protein
VQAVRPDTPSWAYGPQLTSPMCSLVFFFITVSASARLSLLLRRLDKERRRRRETCSDLLRRRRSPRLLLLLMPVVPALQPAPPSMVTLPGPSPAAPRRPAAPTLRSAPPNGAGTAGPTCGDRSLDCQLATKAIAQGEASSHGAEALRPHLLLRLRRPDADSEGGRTRIQCMLQSVHFKCFRCFRGMLQVFYKDVAKVNRDVAYVAMVVHCCIYLQWFSNVLRCFCKCFRRMLQVF